MRFPKVPFWNRALLLKMLLWLSDFRDVTLAREFSQQRISQGGGWRWSQGSWNPAGWDLPPCPAGTQELCLGAPPRGNLQLWQQQAPKTMEDKQLTLRVSHFLLEQLTWGDCGTLKCPPGPKITPLFIKLHCTDGPFPGTESLHCTRVSSPAKSFN